MTKTENKDKKEKSLFVFIGLTILIKGGNTKNVLVLMDKIGFENKLHH